MTTLRNNLESARLLERWLSDASDQVRNKAHLQRTAFASSRSRDVAMRMAEVHERAADVYSKELAVLRVELGGKS